MNNSEIGQLSELALKHGTDKWGSHYYTQHYSKFFDSLRDKKLKILEIGVGGYKDKSQGAQSLKMWKDFFHNSHIYALDIEDKTHFSEDRITIFQGNQVDKKFLLSLNSDFGPFDIIIDDGSHVNKHIIKTFKILFPLLKDNGIYAIEDIQTSYWKAFGGNSYNFFNQNNAVNFFKTFADSLNYEEFDNPYYQPSYIDQNIKSVNFYHNLVIVEKGKNHEGSNIVKENRISTGGIRSNFKYFIVNFLYKIFGKRKP